jgi:broad specificity phosphatase PhoE
MEVKNEIISIVVSHNTRLQCLLDKIRNESTPKIRYMNCVIFKLVITNTNLELSMIYKGELEEHEQHKISLKRPYYTNEDLPNPMDDPDWIGDKPKTPKSNDSKWLLSESNDDIENQFLSYLSEPINDKLHPDTKLINDSDLIIKPLIYYTPYKTKIFKHRLGLPDTLTTNYTFYLVRHGQALHNATNTYGATLDTPLTQLGHKQATNAAIFLKNYIKTNNYNYDNLYFFVSDLRRTHETCAHIQDQIRNFKHPPIVLPCSHEITTKGNDKGNCDQVAANSNLYKKLARENYTQCTTIKGKDGIYSTKNNPLCNQNVDWEFYLDFYNNKVRGENNSASNYFKSFFQSTQESPTQCRTTNMIAEIFNYLKPQRPIGGKKTKKRKYTKKLKHF